MTEPSDMSESEVKPVESLLSDVSFDLGWSLLDRYSILVRESGTPDERAAANFVVTRIKSLEIRHEVHEPDLYLSVPMGASVKAGGMRFDAKPPSFSASTAKRGLSAPPVFIPGTPLRGTADLFGADSTSDADADLDADAEADPDSTSDATAKPKAKPKPKPKAKAKAKVETEPESPDVAGKIVVTEGYPMPVSVARYEAAGAAGQIYINPGSRTHWGICTTIWGTPGESQLGQRPRTPVAAINRRDGNELVAAIKDGLDKVTLRTELREGWYPCLVPVALIDGKEEDFVLVHGHYDSWDVGIGDNAVGDATLLELARIFFQNRELLTRSLRIAWWPGHSTGRYGGSAWYADAFAHDLSRRCVATVNIDSPGCWRATEYDEVPWMAEAGKVCRESIQSVAGVEPRRQRPLRAGDYSFNQLGITSFFMLLSNIPEEERARLGYYPVGGCGGNIAWHTEHDRLNIADRANLERDLRIYVTAIGRMLTEEIVPLDFRETADELSEALEGYEAAVDKRLPLVPLRKKFDAFRVQLDAFYDEIEAGTIDPATANEALLELSRVLVHLGYAEGDRFEHDPALPLPPIPKLARIRELADTEEWDPERLPFLFTELRRQYNKVFELVYQASQVIVRAKETAKLKAAARSG